MNVVDVEYAPEEEDEEYLRKVMDAVGGKEEVQGVLKKNELTGLGWVPSGARGEVWRWFLLRDWGAEELARGDENFEREAEEAMNALDSPMQELLRVDSKRTRPKLERFKKEGAKEELVKILAVFCSREGVRYVQGLNEIAAMFMLLGDIGVKPNRVCQMMTSFIHKYIPWDVESTEESDTSALAFSKLKFCFQAVDVLLRFHDIELHTRLHSNFIVEATFALWDAIILENDRSSFYFFALALLISRRELLMQINEAHMPVELMMLAAHTKEEVWALWAWGSKLRANTPKSFVNMLSNPYIVWDVNQLSPAGSTMVVEVEDLFKSGVNPSQQYLIWDCRTRQEYESGRIGRATFMGLEGLRLGSQHAAIVDLQRLLEMNEPFRSTGTKICLVGCGNLEQDALDVLPAATCLGKNGFRYICYLRGGFAEVLRRAPEQIVDLDQEALYSAQALRKRQEERHSYAKERGVPEGVMAIVNRTDADLMGIFGRAKGTIDRIGWDLRHALGMGENLMTENKEQERLLDERGEPLSGHSDSPVVSQEEVHPAPLKE